MFSVSFVFKTIACISIIAGTVGLAVMVSQAAAITVFLETHLTPDGEIENPETLFIALYTGPIFLMVSGLILFQMVRIEFFDRNQRHRWAGVASLQPSLAGTLTFFAVGMVFFLQFVVGCHMRTPFSQSLCLPYEKEGFYELLTAGAFLAASVWLALLARSWRRQARAEGQTGAKLQVYGLFLVALLCFVVGMEEISWGQTYLGWETPDYLAAVNEQNETNLHNLFNSHFEIAYIVGGSLVLIGTFLTIWLVASGRVGPRWQILFPNPNLIGLAFWFPLAAATTSEPVEFLAAIYLMAYCWGLHSQLRFLDRSAAKVPDKHMPVVG